MADFFVWVLDHPAICVSILYFIAIYLAMSFEHIHGFPKEPLALIGAIGLYLIAVYTNSHDFNHALVEVESEIQGIVFFLFPAMTLVELLLQMGFFRLIQSKLQQKGYRDRKQLHVLSLITFFCSAVLDNLTTTLVMVNAVNQSFRDEENRHRAAGATVANANAGGAWSPIGDVTTIMLWLSGKFTALQVIAMGFLPALAHSLVVTAMLSGRMKNSEPETVTIEVPSFSAGQRIVIASALGSFALPLIFSQLGLRPYFGLLVGLGITWILQEHLAQQDDSDGVHEREIDHYIGNLIRLVDHRSLFFFTGILLMVGALGQIGALAITSGIILGDNPSTLRIIIFCIVLGLISPVVDNVPLTAIAIDMVPFQDPWQAVLLALCVGTGGSMLILGSVAGVVVMGRVAGLNSGTYARIMFAPVLIGYIVQTIVFLIQYRLFGNFL